MEFHSVSYTYPASTIIPEKKVLTNTISQPSFYLKPLQDSFSPSPLFGTTGTTGTGKAIGNRKNSQENTLTESRLLAKLIEQYPNDLYKVREEFLKDPEIKKFRHSITINAIKKAKENLEHRKQAMEQTIEQKRNELKNNSQDDSNSRRKNDKLREPIKNPKERKRTDKEQFLFNKFNEAVQSNKVKKPGQEAYDKFIDSI